MTEHDAIFSLLLQIAVILGVSRVVGMAFVRLGQPQVVGEMIAGIMLGPSLFGWLAPEAAAYVFPAGTLRYLHVLSQLGVILFLFLIGLELDPKLLRQQGQRAIVISHVSIVVPFLLGAILALYLFPRLFNHTPMMRFTAVALFMGAAMSITAFPVLARILTERNLHKTAIGVVTITCAAVDDVTAWCMLAFVVAVSRATGLAHAVQTLGLALVYVMVMLMIVRPLLLKLERFTTHRGKVNQAVIAAVLLLVLASALATQGIGIHALFGAFMMGAIMPKGRDFVAGIAGRLEDLTVTLLLPIFFAYAGLKTQIGLIHDPAMLGDTLLIILTACLGKFGGSTLAARSCGMTWRDASTVGILMNTRGLMELVILNIGREMGVLSDAVFTMMVLMAIVTTALTTPLLRLFQRQPLAPIPVTPSSEAGPPAFHTLVCIARAEHGAGLLRLSQAIGGPNSSIHALHLIPPAERDAYLSAAEGAESVRDEVLDAVIAQAAPHRTPIEPISHVSHDRARDIVSFARSRKADLVLMGYHQPVFGSSILGGVVHQVLTNCPCDVGIFVNRGFIAPRRVLVPYLGGPHDKLALETARRLARDAQAIVTVLHVTPRKDPSTPRLGADRLVERVFHDPSQPTPVTFKVLESDDPVEAALREAAEADLVVIGLAEKWGLESHLVAWRHERITQQCATSMLIVRKCDADAANASP